MKNFLSTMNNYLDLYLQDDVLLLAFTFETFRKESINPFKLDPVYYLSTPAFSRDATLSFADVNSKLI